MDVSSWSMQSELHVTSMPAAPSFSTLEPVAPAGGGHLCVELHQQPCTDGSGAAVVVHMSGNTYPLAWLFSDWRGSVHSRGL